MISHGPAGRPCSRNVDGNLKPDKRGSAGGPGQETGQRRIKLSAPMAGAIHVISMALVLAPPRWVTLASSHQAANVIWREVSRSQGGFEHAHMPSIFRSRLERFDDPSQQHGQIP
jgi:hypothetical protein